VKVCGPVLPPGNTGLFISKAKRFGAPTTEG
jgi:hypothetical protein